MFWGPELILDSDDQNFSARIGNWTFVDDSTDSDLVRDTTNLSFAGESGDDRQAKITIDETTDPCGYAYGRLDVANWPVSANAYYIIKAQIAIPAANTLKDVKIRAYFFTLLQEATQTLSDDTWTTLSFLFTPDADVLGSIDIGFDGNPADGDVLYFDDVSVKEVLPVTRCIDGMVRVQYIGE